MVTAIKHDEMLGHPQRVESHTVMRGLLIGLNLDSLEMTTDWMARFRVFASDAVSRQ